MVRLCSGFLWSLLHSTFQWHIAEVSVVEIEYSIYFITPASNGGLFANQCSMGRQIVLGMCHVIATATSMLSRDSFFFLRPDRVCLVDSETCCSRFGDTIAELPSRVLWSDTTCSYLVAL